MIVLLHTQGFPQDQEPSARHRAHIAVVSPVTRTEAFLEKLRIDYDSRALGALTSFYFPEQAPAVIETAADARAAEAGITAEALAAAKSGANAIVVSCFSDPGVQAASAATGIPVLGEGRPSIAAAGALFDRFSILSSQSSTIEAKRQQVDELGLTDCLHRITGLDIGVAELTSARAPEIADFVAAEAAGGAKAVILGCTGLEPGFTIAVRRQVHRLGLSTAVIDPVEVVGRLALAAAFSVGAP